MIIVEGPDGSGKTTLAKRLHEDLNARGLNVSLNVSKGDVPQDPLGKALDAIADSLRWRHDPSKFRPVIYDRLVLSEVVYGRILRESWQAGLNPQAASLLLGMMGDLRTPLIFCMPPAEQIVENALRSEQLGGVKENLEEICDYYSQIFHILYEGRNDTAKTGNTPELFVWDYTKESDTAWKKAGPLGFHLRPEVITPYEWASTQYDDLLGCMTAYINNVDCNIPAGEISTPPSLADKVIQAIKDGEAEVVEVPTGGDNPISDEYNQTEEGPTLL